MKCELLVLGNDPDAKIVPLCFSFYVIRMG